MRSAWASDRFMCTRLLVYKALFTGREQVVERTCALELALQTNRHPARRGRAREAPAGIDKGQTLPGDTAGTQLAADQTFGGAAPPPHTQAFEEQDVVLRLTRAGSQPAAAVTRTPTQAFRCASRAVLNSTARAALGTPAAPRSRVQLCMAPAELSALAYAPWWVGCSASTQTGLASRASGRAGSARIGFGS